MRPGQGVVESVFAIGILILLLSGAVILIIFGANNRQNSFDRRRATELASMVTEELIAKSKNSPETFWQFADGGEDLQKTEFANYTYSIGFTNITNNVSYPQCGIGKTDCAEVVVKIDWQGKNPQSLYFNRFFSKNE